MLKVIVTGVSGQVGSLMAEYLLEKYEDIKVYGAVRRLSVSNHKNIEHIKDSRFELIDFDLTDPCNIQQNIEKIKPDYFLNFAAQSHVHVSWENPVLTWQVNSTGVLYILEAIRKLSPHTRFMSSGSSEERGDHISNEPQNEDQPLSPRSPYAASKAAARHLVKVYRDSYGLYACQATSYNHDSPRRDEMFLTRKVTKGLSRISRAIDRGTVIEPLRLGNLDSFRDWSHAKDIIDGVWKMMNQDRYSKSWETRGKIPMNYVFSSGEAHSVREFVNSTLSYLGLKGEWSGKGADEKFSINLGGKSTPIIQIDPKFYRPAEVHYLLGDSSLAREDLSWSPKYSFNDLVKEMTLYDLLEE